jgi:hypothetical protein
MSFQDYPLNNQDLELSILQAISFQANASDLKHTYFNYEVMRIY